MSKTYRRHEITLSVNADHLLALIAAAPGVEVETYGHAFPVDLKNSLVRTVEYDPLAHEILLVVEGAGTNDYPVMRGQHPERYFIRAREESKEEPCVTEP